MGLYIPPQSGRNNNGKNDPDLNNNSVSKSDSDEWIFYSRPSIGLKLWGPLVPASDYRPGLWGVTAAQTLLGLVMLKNVKTIWQIKTTFARFSKTLSLLASGYLIFNAGLEVSRLSLPYDPWREEAKRAREDALKMGQKPNFWFGPWDYKPMSFKEWNEKVNGWLQETEEAIERGENPFTDGTHSNKNFTMVVGPEYHQIYLHLVKVNRERSSVILQQLNDKSFEDILPNYQTHRSAREQTTIVLPDGNELKDDDDLEEVWSMNDPWVSLGHDTDYTVRLIPKFRWTDLSESDVNQSKEQEQLVEASELPQQHVTNVGIERRL